MSGFIVQQGFVVTDDDGGGGSGGGVIPFPDNSRMHFRGNSWTLGADAGNPYFNVDQGVEALLTAAGLVPGDAVTYAVDSLDFQAHAPGGTNGTASLASVNSGTWSHGILQNITSAAADLADHLTYGEILAEQYFTNNAGAQVLLFETPPYAFGHPSYPSVFTDPKTMHIETRAAYDDLAVQVNAANPARKPTAVAPVGSAIYYGGACLPSSHRQYKAMHAADDLLHQNGDGYVQTCLNIFIRITNRNPAGLLDSTAWQAIEAAMTSQPVLDPRWHEDHAYQCTRFGRYPLLFLKDPADITVAEGEDAVFSAEVDGSGPITYQWFRDGNLLSEETSSTISLPAVTEGDDGSVFMVRATNARGSVDSLEATLTVGVPVLIPFSIDFASLAGTATPGWTRITAPSDAIPNIVGSTFPLLDRSGNPTPYVLRILANTGATGANNNGASGVLGLPPAVTTTHWVGVTGGSYQFRIENLPQIPIVNEACGFRNAGDNGNLDLGYVGATSGTLTFNSRTTPASIPKVTITPDSNGHITFTVTSGTGNVSGFNYLSFLRGDPPP